MSVKISETGLELIAQSTFPFFLNLIFSALPLKWLEGKKFPLHAEVMDVVNDIF